MKGFRAEEVFFRKGTAKSQLRCGGKARVAGARAPCPRAWQVSFLHSTSKLHFFGFKKKAPFFSHALNCNNDVRVHIVDCRTMTKSGVGRQTGGRAFTLHCTQSSIPELHYHAGVVFDEMCHSEMPCATNWQHPIPEAAM